MKKFTEKAQDYFDRHPMSEECHITSDERVFHTLGSAQSMAGTLDNQDIESYKRTVLEKELKADKKTVIVSIDKLDTGNTVSSKKDNDPVDVNNKVSDVIQKGAAALSNDKEEKLKELSELELVTGNYQQMKALANFFELKTENQKAETLITALTDFKTTLNQ